MLSKLCVAVALLDVADAFTPGSKDDLTTALADWMGDASSAEATYGHISTWDTGLITDMSYIFCGSDPDGYSYWAEADSFNDDIGSLNKFSDEL